MLTSETEIERIWRLEDVENNISDGEFNQEEEYCIYGFVEKLK